MRNVKRIFIILILLLITIFVYSVPVESGSISFKGLIEPGLYFFVSELNPQIYNLIANQDLQPDGEGVEIGTWTLRVDNPPIEETNYGVTYSYEPLTAVGIEDTIDFIILEKTEDDVTIEQKLDQGSSAVTISSTPGLNIVTRILSARLTAEGVVSAVNAAASEDYTSNITVALSTE